MGRKSDARQRLLEAALSLIWEHSYASTSVDAICERAGVTKGSFYHFFESKCALTAAAVRESHDRNRALMDSVFSPTKPPLERLKNFFDSTYASQRDLKATHGCVLGCPTFSLAAEICHDDVTLRATTGAILDDYLAYFESAIRDARAAGLIECADTGAKARGLLSLFEGALAHARIRDDPELLRNLAGDAFAYLGTTCATVPA